ncbi:LuxR C-terminal-related transcriptional regulator [Streptomyces sp. ST2-7A]|uniref:helix-turn-helix transcriptional regulator n=1 Tax=Streptomyces sp. ST2-7A TaxID=2907214 RepID=UPI001F441D7C|nr:LuxR C-terminal-related transcriptional regulator [Streptomyces sp. ST2-7A]MCE7082041.1 LuxR C-terminal-related transcriptional regulator [Streptomyces sp. ST2-7A]
MGDPVSVSVVALDPVLEAGTRSTLLNSPDLSLVDPGGETRVVVMIVDRVGAPELEALRTTREAPRPPDVVLVASELTVAETLHALTLGARGLLRRREADAGRLARAVLAAGRGDCTLPPDLLDRLLERSASPGAGDGEPVSIRGAGDLNDRERAVLRLVADGHETNEIARRLCYSPRTVSTVVHDITRRFRLRNRAHAVAYALRAGLL